MNYHSEDLRRTTSTERGVSERKGERPRVRIKEESKLEAIGEEQNKGRGASKEEAVVGEKKKESEGNAMASPDRPAISI